MNNVAILLAAYNGEKWIREQIESILIQKDVSIKIFISLDLSNDNTMEIIESIKCIHENIEVLPVGERYGSAGRNFYRLIRDVNVESFNYIALADQDDIWKDDKLERAISFLEDKYDGYASNVEAFWQNGTRKRIIKSQKQKKYDHFFQSGGPGCTIVLNSNSYKELRNFVIENFEKVCDIELHDWLIYFFYRIKNKKWIIDDWESMYYRQHSENEFGANQGLASLGSRYKKFESGWLFNESCKLSKLFNIETSIEDLLNVIQLKPFTCRRSKIESLILFVFSVIYRFKYFSNMF